MTRSYVSPKREAKAAATREAILEAFVDQMSEPGWVALSPTDAARQAGVSVRTVHTHFPNQVSQVEALAEWFDRQTFPDGVAVARGPDDLPRYFREIHARALRNPRNRALANLLMKWPEVRQHRRSERLDAIRAAVQQVGAPLDETEDTTAVLLALSGADVSWPMHDLHGLPIERIPDAIAKTVSLLVTDLEACRQPANSTEDPNR